MLAALIADGVVAVDMETAAVAAVCEERGVPWSVFRAISDRASDAGLIGDAILDVVNRTARSTWAPGPRLLITKPHRIPHLVRMGRGSQAAADAAARCGGRVYPVVAVTGSPGFRPGNQRDSTPDCPARIGERGEDEHVDGHEGRQPFVEPGCRGQGHEDRARTRRAPAP